MNTPYQIHEALVEHIEKSGFPPPTWIIYPRDTERIPAGKYGRDESGIWVLVGPVPKRIQKYA